MKDRAYWTKQHDDARANLRKWLHHYKDTTGLTNDALAAEIGLSEPTITNVLNGKRTPALDMLLHLSRSYGESAQALLFQPPPAQEAASQNPRPAFPGSAPRRKSKITG